jgi:hypothetical protein
MVREILPDTVRNFGKIMIASSVKSPNEKSLFQNNNMNKVYTDKEISKIVSICKEIEARRYDVTKTEAEDMVRELRSIVMSNRYLFEKTSDIEDGLRILRGPKRNSRRETAINAYLIPALATLCHPNSP